jgi:hypothetical protein
VPPAAAAALAALKADLRAKTLQERQAERERLAELLGPAATADERPAEVGIAEVLGVAVELAEPRRERQPSPDGYGGHVPAWAAEQWKALHPDLDLDQGTGT